MNSPSPSPSRLNYTSISLRAIELARAAAPEDRQEVIIETFWQSFHAAYPESSVTRGNFTRNPLFPIIIKDILDAL